MSSNIVNIQDCVQFNIKLIKNNPEFIQFSKNIRQIGLETQTDIEFLQIVRISGEIKNINEANQRVSQLINILAQNVNQNDLKNEVHNIWQSKMQEMENSYVKKIHELTKALAINKFQIDAIITKGQEYVRNEVHNIWQSKMQEMENSYVKKIHELTKALAINKFQIDAIITKGQEYVRNEVHNIWQSKMQEMENSYVKKIHELTKALAINKFQIDAIITKGQEYVRNEVHNIWQSKMQEMENSYVKKIHELTKALAINKFQIDAIITKGQEYVRNEGVTCTDVFKSEMFKVQSKICNVESKMQEIRNTFEQKIVQLSTAMSNIQLKNEATYIQLQKNVSNVDSIDYSDLIDFYESDEYVNCKQYKGEQPLHTACRFGRLDLVKKLIKSGISPYIKDGDGFTPLHYSCWFGHLNVVQYLIELNVPINDLDWKFGDTPLIKASRKGYKAIVEYLCSKNAKVHIENKEGSTAIYEASGTDRNQIVKILKKYGAEY